MIIRVKEGERMEKKFISAPEAAELLGLSRATVDRHAKKGSMPSYLVGDRRLFDPDELIEWVKSHRNDRAKRAPKKKKGK